MVSGPETGCGQGTVQAHRAQRSGWGDCHRAAFHKCNCPAVQNDPPGVSEELDCREVPLPPHCNLWGGRSVQTSLLEPGRTQSHLGNRKSPGARLPLLT